LPDQGRSGRILEGNSRPALSSTLPRSYLPEILNQSFSRRIRVIYTEFSEVKFGINKWRVQSRTMWLQYKRNFLGIQVLSGGATAWVYFGLTHNWASAAWIFLVMQVGGVLGAAWATRLRRKILAAR
jgi:hypothetical protein